VQVKTERAEMKRDMDLARAILIEIEEDPHLDRSKLISASMIDPDEIKGAPGHSKEEVAYHLALLIEAGLVEGKVGLEQFPLISGLTWNGHEFLDNIRDSGIWGKTKARIKDIPSVALSVVIEIAKSEVRKHLGLP